MSKRISKKIDGCEFKRTDIWWDEDANRFKSKTWQCSRKAKHDLQSTNCMGKKMGWVRLCTQHLKVANDYKFGAT